jgi:hypothetical protein
MTRIEEAIAIASAIPGWMEPEEMSAIAAVADGAENACEVGCFQGRTTKLLSMLCTGVVFAVDWFNSINPTTGIDWFDPAEYGQTARTYRELFDQHLASEIASGKVIVCPNKSHEGAELIESTGMLLDLCFIDAGHDLEQVRCDIAAYLPLMKPGGTMCGHDYYPEGVDVEGHDHEVAIPVHEAFGNNVRQEGICWFART